LLDFNCWGGLYISINDVELKIMLKEVQKVDEFIIDMKNKYLRPDKDE